MPRIGFSVWVLGLALGYPAGAVLADPPASTPQPTAADAKSGKDPVAAKPAKHKPAQPAGGGHDADAKRDGASTAADASAKPTKHKPAEPAIGAADASDKPAKHATEPAAAEASATARHKHTVSDKPTPQPAAAAPSVATKPAPAAAPPPIAAAPKPAGPTCSLEEPEQPRGGRLDVLGNDFGKAPVVRIAAKPARMIERRSDRISVQVPADSDGGPITVQSDGRSLACGNLVIIGKNR
jgi:hypothetical protein